MVFLIAFATFLSTMLGGSFALRLKDKLHLILGFSAGAVIGVGFFDLLPEALELGTKQYEIATVVSITALGFLIYLALDRLVIHHRHEEDLPAEASTHLARGRALAGQAGASTLSFHSFLDGVGIGFAFQVSAAIGLVVAAAVLAHDFSDGINTVNFVLKNGGSRKQAFGWLLVDAIAPVLGVMVTLFFAVSEQSLGLILALFAGFFLYIGASDLIPESHHAHPTRLTTVMTIVGAAVLYVVIRIAG